MRVLLQQRWREILGGGVIAVAVAVVFRGILRNSFLLSWDDQMAFENPHLQALTWENVKWMFTDASYHPRHIYMPFAWLWWCVVNVMLGPTPGIYHSINLGLHALNGVLVFALLRKILLRVPSSPPGESGRTQVVIAALFGALWWALHPLRVEPVAWAVTQKFLIATALLIATLFLWLRWLDEQARGANGTKWYAWSLGGFVSSLLFYPLGVPMPGVLLLLAVSWPREDTQAKSPVRWGRIFLALAPFLLASGLVMIPALLYTYEQPAGSSPQVAAAAISWPAHAMEAAYIWTYYVWKPFTLGSYSPVYAALLNFDPTARAFVGSAIALVTLTALALALRRRYPWVLVLWLCHLCLLVPVLGIGINSENFTNDRYAYVPGIVWSALLALVLVRLPWSKWTAPVRSGALVAGIAALAVFGRAAAQQTAIWRDNIALFQHILRQLDGADYSREIQKRLGYYHMDMRQAPQAHEAFIVLARMPNARFEDLTAATDQLSRLRDPAAAADALSRAAKLRPGFEIYDALASLNYQAGRPAEAIAALREALRYKADAPTYWKLSVLFAGQNRWDEALQSCDDALHLMPGNTALLDYRSKLVQAAAQNMR